MTPADLGFQMPAEWHPHEATWLAWPKDPQTWPGRVPRVRQMFIQMISLLAAHERVELLVDDQEAAADVHGQLRQAGAAEGGIRFHTIPTVDAWIRDYGPNFLLRRQEEEFELAYNHWQFNAWGNKYPELKRDTIIPETLEAYLRVRRFVPDMVLEGGSIDVNGEGCCLTTEQCLLNPNRNPGLSRRQIEERLRAWLGVEVIIWLGEGITGDDTDGHVDDVARFVSADTIVCAVEEDPGDENYDSLQENLRRLRLARDVRGRPFQIVPLPMPGRIEGDGARLPASYANFYIANEVVLAPIFGRPNDSRALDILQQLFPRRSVAGLSCEPLVWGMGTLHCVTQQQPAWRIRWLAG